eukprot:gene7187-16951_t
MALAPREGPLWVLRVDMRLKPPFGDVVRRVALPGAAILYPFR